MIQREFYILVEHEAKQPNFLKRPNASSLYSVKWYFPLAGVNTSGYAPSDFTTTTKFKITMKDASVIWVQEMRNETSTEVVETCILVASNAFECQFDSGIGFRATHFEYSHSYAVILAFESTYCISYERSTIEEPVVSIHSSVINLWREESFAKSFFWMWLLNINFVAYLEPDERSVMMYLTYSWSNSVNASHLADMINASDAISLSSSNVSTCVFRIKSYHEEVAPQLFVVSPDEFIKENYGDPYIHQDGCVHRDSNLSSGIFTMSVVGAVFTCNKRHCISNSQFLAKGDAFPLKTLIENQCKVQIFQKLNNQNISESFPLLLQEQTMEVDLLVDGSEVDDETFIAASGDVTLVTKNLT